MSKSTERVFYNIDDAMSAGITRVGEDSIFIDDRQKFGLPWFGPDSQDVFARTDQGTFVRAGWISVGIRSGDIIGPAVDAQRSVLVGRPLVFPGRYDVYVSFERDTESWK